MRFRPTGRHRALRKGPTASRVLVPIAFATGIGSSTQAWAIDSQNSGGKPPAAPPQMLSVVQQNITFNPTQLLIKPGDSVTWTNKETDQTTHSVVQGNGSEINSPDMPPGETFVWKFDKPGEWDIVCRFHTDMFMTIGVVGKDGKVPPSAPYVPAAPSKPAPPTPSQGTLPGITGLPIAHHSPNHRAR
jgi:plastocyanin